MKIILKEYGGWAPNCQRILDTSSLSEGRDKTENLAAKVLSQHISSGFPHPDEMGYKLIIHDGNESREINSLESTATPELLELVGHVRNFGTIENN